MSTLVAVYGTLLSGLHNNYLLNQARFIGKGQSVFHGTMFSAGGFPILSFEEPESKVQVELYEVPDHILARLDALEGYPEWYQRTVKTFEIEGEKIKAYIYHQDLASNSSMPVVTSGDWKAYRKGEAL